MPMGRPMVCVRALLHGYTVGLSVNDAMGRSMAGVRGLVPWSTMVDHGLVGPWTGPWVVQLLCIVEYTERDCSIFHFMIQ